MLSSCSRRRLSLHSPTTALSQTHCASKVASTGCSQYQIAQVDEETFYFPQTSEGDPVSQSSNLLLGIINIWFREFQFPVIRSSIKKNSPVSTIDFLLYTSPNSLAPTALKRKKCTFGEMHIFFIIIKVQRKQGYLLVQYCHSRSFPTVKNSLY